MSNNLQSGIFSGRSILAPTLFGVLAKELRESLLADAPLRRFDNGQLVQQHGDEADGFWVIEEGVVLVGQFLAQGEFRAVARLVAGDSYGELAVLAGNRRVVDAIASGPAAMRWIDAGRYRKALECDPQSLASLSRALAVQLQEMIGATATARSGSVAQRLAGLLLNLRGAGSGDEAIRASQQQLADLMGLTRVTVNKGLAELENAGLIRRDYGRIEILDAAGLGQFIAEP